MDQAQENQEPVSEAQEALKEIAKARSLARQADSYSNNGVGVKRQSLADLRADRDALADELAPPVGRVIRQVNVRGL